MAPARVRPLRRVEYERMVDQGLFHDERIELLRGAIIEMSPQGPPHAAVVQRLNTRLVIALAGRAEVRVQLPLAVTDDSLPEPDVALVAPGDYDAGHPTTAFLVVEVADSSLNKDRLIKAELYARAGVPEYWIANIAAGVIEAHTDQVGDRYTRITPFRPGETLRLRAFPDVEIPVSSILR
ncbi:MAG TPA: Uma2 family endonuclease [Polyangia bacterium]|nr:Uma2 family endonuclease [Polyangia bacterium]